MKQTEKAYVPKSLFESGLEIKVKLDEGAKLPQKAHPSDAGYDLVALTKEITNDGVLRFGTGVHINIPKGYYGLLTNRSSIAKYNMNLIQGTIDSGYTGEIKVQLKVSTVGRNIYKEGDRVAQLIILPCPATDLVEVEELEETERSDSGFGASGT